MAIRTSIPQPSLCGGRYISRNGMELEVICAVAKKNWFRAKTGPGGPFLVAKNCLPGPEMCLSLPKVVLWGISVKRTMKMPPNVSKDGSGRHGLIQQQSRRPDGGGLPVHDPKALHVSLWMHGRSKEKHKAISNVLLFFCHCFTSFCSCINVTLLIKPLWYTKH